MGEVKVTDAWSFNGIKAIILENSQLRATVFPELGAKIYDITYKPIQKNILWHNPRIKPSMVAFGTTFDDVWCGGWDEIFPNDAPSTVNGEKYPDMGEVWSIPWDYEIKHEENVSNKDAVTLTTKTSSPISACRITRSMTLIDHEPAIHLVYTLKNTGTATMKFLWKLHPSFEINDSCTIQIPGTVGIVDPRYQRLYSKSSYRYDWPKAVGNDGKPVDISKILPPSARTCSLHYVTDLRGGWVKLLNPKENFQVTISFPKEVLHTIWLFLAYGGYRSLYTAVIEPSTSYPYDLAEAIQEGRCSELEPDQELRCKVDVELSQIP